jgi:hypothetical protein
MTDAAPRVIAAAGPPPTLPDHADRGQPVLLVPVPELPAADDAGVPQLTVAFRELAGETVAEGYTSLERLVEGCGPAQPWVAFPLAASIRLLAAAGASVLIVDPRTDCGTVGLDLTCAVSATEGACR